MKTEQEIEEIINAEAARNRQALDHIRALISAHDADFEKWCARRRRHDAFLRTALAACLFALFTIGADTAYAAAPAPDFTGNAFYGDILPAQAADTVSQILSLIYESRKK